jgi:phage host-nuclease inhibitor protein Gam
MKAKTQPPLEELKSIAECEEAMHRLLTHTTRREELEAERDRLIGDTNRMYQPGIDLVAGHQQNLQLQLQQYYLTHAAEIEKGGAKILKLAAGVMGMRLTKPSLQLLNKKWTWESVRATLHMIFGEKFDRIKPPELNKQLVKTDLPAEQLKEYGLKLDQDEVFYAEPLRPAHSSQAA